jgi:N-acetyl-anhydromuramyl-L-alanine amidase AmpD
VAALRAAVEPFVDDPQDLFAPPKADRAWKYVVLHHSATPKGSYAQIDREHRQVRGYTGCGYHFVIGNGTDSPDGRVEVARRWSDQKAGAHCRDGKHPDVNEYGIGICLIGDCDKTPPTPKQVEAARALVAYLEARYAIAPDRVGTHALLAGTPTACPGKQFPTQAILKSRNLVSR